MPKYQEIPRRYLWAWPVLWLCVQALIRALNRSFRARLGQGNGIRMRLTSKFVTRKQGCRYKHRGFGLDRALGLA
ncbi:hypothetical protein Z947_1235 [Sulfitobacter geojensis]|nr:hypothetical protein Z947_1235 [Sulfitobacter geojensis]